MRSRAPRLVPMMLLLAAIAASSAGCYKRVVRIEGFGSRTTDTYEPNANDRPDLLDDIMWGEKTPTRKK